jgi:DNA-binding Lrp family transcriptional regulator
MGRGSLTLDQIWSATSTFTVRWSAGLESNKAHRVLHYLLCRLYDEGRGHLVNAQITLAQATLARKLGISRQWVGTLINRLAKTGWIEHHSHKLSDGTNSSTIWRVGRTLKRVLVMLSKSRRAEKLINTPAKSRWHFSPLKTVREDFFILKKRKEVEDALPDAKFYASNPRLDWFRIQHEAAIKARSEKEGGSHAGGGCPGN